MNKKIAHLILILTALCFVLNAFAACSDERRDLPDVQPNTYKVEFNVQHEGGKIVGERVQNVVEGQSTSKVVAVANVGYYFAGWSDTGPEYDETVTSSERVVENVRKECGFLAMFEKITLEVRYIAGENGNIEGELIQNRKYGENGGSVTAVPNTGYRFKEWSDGEKDATRSESDLTENKELTAEFEIITNEYVYEYKLADGNCDIPSVSLTYGRLDGVSMPVPTREHGTFGGWFADRYLTEQVADDNGNVVIGDELFYGDCTRFYAKWISENTHPYKILLVYVTELKGLLKKSDLSGEKYVDYKMTETERTICGMLTEKLEWELDDLAVADFQVDEYYTTVPLTAKDVMFYTKDNFIEPSHVSEIQDITPYYDTVLLSFSMNDYFGELHSDGGACGGKYGHVHFDGNFTQMLYDKHPIESALDPLCPYWPDILDTYLHELAHSIELSVSNLFDFHKAASKYAYLGSLWYSKYYFLNKAVIDGETVGIPYEFWEGKVAVALYEPNYRGYGHVGSVIHHNALEETPINSEMQNVILNNYAIGVYAEPYDGYEFVEWSDGVKTSERKDFITGDLHVYAIFRQKE